MTAAELENLVNQDTNVQSASDSLRVAKAKFDAAVSARDVAYGYWQEKEADVSKSNNATPPGLKNQRKLLRDKAKDDYFLKRDQADSASAEYNSALKIYDDVKKAANDRIIAQANIVQASQIAASEADEAKAQAAATGNVAKAAETQKESIAERLKANKKYIVWGLVAVILVVTAVIVIKKYAK